VDQNALIFACVVLWNILATWWILRMPKVWAIHREWLAEEEEWVEGHPALFTGHYERHMNLPGRLRMVLSVWIPLNDYYEAAQPVQDYYFFKQHG